MEVSPANGRTRQAIAREERAIVRSDKKRRGQINMGIRRPSAPLTLPTPDVLARVDVERNVRSRSRGHEIRAGQRFTCLKIRTGFSTGTHKVDLPLPFPSR